MTSRMLVDVTQFVSHPVATGIQRTLLELARCWPTDDVEVEVGAVHEGSHDYLVAPLSALLEIAEDVFDNERTVDANEAFDPGWASRLFFDRATTLIRWQDIPLVYEGYMLPEVTFRDDVLDTFEHCVRWMSSRCFAVVYDAIPQTNPDVFAAPHQGATSRYFLALRQLVSGAFISQATKRVVEERLLHAATPNTLQMHLGADGIGSESNPTPSPICFVVGGRIEPRKRLPLVLDAFEELWSTGHDFRLKLFGAPGWGSEAVVARLHREMAYNPRFEWSKGLSDAEVHQVLRTATAVIYPSRDEGYGLPPLEALALGVPVIVSTDLPSVADLPEFGQIRLRDLSPSSLARAVKELADPARNTRFRQDIRALNLPTWEQCIHTLAAWVQTTLDASA